MRYTDVSLEDLTKSRGSPVEIGNEGKTVKIYRYVNSISVPAPVDSQRLGNIQSIPLYKDMNKMRFFYFRGDFEEQELAEIAKIVRDGYDVDSGTFKDDKAVEEKLQEYKICDYEIKDVMQGEKGDYGDIEQKIPSIPMDIQVVSDGEKIFIRYSVNYGPFVFSKIAKTVEECYDKASGTVRDEEKLEKIIEGFGKTFGIERKHLVSAVHWGLDGRPLTPPPGIICDFEKMYFADKLGKIHVPEDDPVVRAIISMILEGKSEFVKKNIFESYDEFKKGKEPVS